MELISRLGEVDPLPDDALMKAEATLQLAMAIAAVDPAPIDVRRRFRNKSGRARRYVAGVGGAAAAALVLVVTFAATSGGGHSPIAQSTSTTHQRETGPAARTTMRLASYSFQLPAGYQTIASQCAVLPPGVTSTIPAAIPLAGQNALAAAASTNGGCIEALLAAGPAIIPTGAKTVHVGPYQGYLTSGTANHVVLYVAMPAARGHHDLILVTRGLSADQVVAIADSSLPWRVPPTERP
jgi:hypothetical protein